MTMKNPKTLWWWQWLCLITSSISARCPDKRLQLSEYKSKAELNNHSLACGWCWLRLLSDWYCIGCQNNKKSLNNNTIQYLWILPSTQYQYHSNPNFQTHQEEHSVNMQLFYLFELSYESCDVFQCHRILNCQLVALALDPNTVHENPSIGCKAYIDIITHVHTINKW